MKLILDTHTLLWHVLDEPRLSSTAKHLIEDPVNEVFVSAASYWELGIKISLGKLKVTGSFDEFVDACEERFQTVRVESRHVVYVSRLPFPKDHRDPFDRLIVAQAAVDDLTIVSVDEKLDQYDVLRRW